MTPKDFLYIFLMFVFLGISFIPDKALVAGTFFIFFLLLITLWIVFKLRPQDKKLFYLVLLVFIIRFVVVLFAHYSDLPMFKGGGDFVLYDQQAHQIANLMHENFSFENFNPNYYIKKGVAIGIYYPVIVGFIYRFIFPDMFVGQMFNAWIVTISAILIYFLVLELGGSKNSAFWVGFLSTLYPSYLYYGTLLLKEAIFIMLCMFGLLLSLKLLRNFKWSIFCILYLTLIGLVNLRFYVAYALMIGFVLSWFLFGKMDIKKRIIWGILIIMFFGFTPQISGYGYFGMGTLKQYANPETISFFRQEAYNPIIQNQQFPHSVQQEFEKTPDGAHPGTRSSIAIDLNFNNPFKFLWTISESFFYVILGPLPWQIKSFKQAFVLGEMIPWYFLLYFVISGSIKSVKKDKVVFCLIFFSILVFGVLALFLSNFGIVTRIRMPAFLSLFCFAVLGFDDSYLQRQIIKFKNFIIKKSHKISLNAKKISN